MLLCALVPLLPVKQTTATIAWPQGAGPDGMVADITAPLVSGAPLALDVSIPCQAIATLPAEGGLVLSTVPREASDATKGGLFVRATADVVFVAFRDTVAAVAPAPRGGRGRAAARCISGPTSGRSAPTSSGFPAPQAPWRRRRSLRSPVSSPT